MSADPKWIGLGAYVSKPDDPAVAQARIDRLKAEAAAFRAPPPLDAGFWTLCAVVAIGLCVLVFKPFNLTRSAAAPTLPALPCPGPGLNEHTYIVLANVAGEIRVQSCTTVHILGRTK